MSSSNQNQNDLTNLINFSQANQNQAAASQNDLLEQAAILQQLFGSQQQQQPQNQQEQSNLHLQQQQPQQLTNGIELNQNFEPPQQLLPLQQQQQQPPPQQELQQQSSLTQQQQQQQQSTMNFRSGLALNSFETLVAAPTPLIPQQVYHPHVLQQQQQQQRPRTNLTEREKFVIFVKILMKLTHNNPSVRSRAKAIISECTRRNRMGDLEYSPLQDAVERRLKNGVGELYWARAKLFFDAYCERNGIRSAGLAQVPVASI